MRIDLSLTPGRTALQKTGGTASGGPPLPPDVKSLPPGLLPGGMANFTDLSNWTLTTGWSDTGGSVTCDGTSATSSNVRSTALTIPAGDIWVPYTLRDATASLVGVQFQGPFINTQFLNKVTAQHVARFQSTGHSHLRILGNAGFDGTIEDIQIVDMTSILAQPADIYIAAGQSLIAADTSGGPIDPDLDYWIPRCLYIPSVDNAAFGTKVGELHACVAPLQMKKASTGVSPATTFARDIEAQTPAGRNVVILGCAEGGTSLLGNDAPWNPDATVGNGSTLYNNMVTRAQAAVAMNPGNQLKGMIWGQGESDRSGTIDATYPPAFTNLLSRLRSDLSIPSLPVILIGPEPDDQLSVQPLFIQTQERLDQDSGHSTAIPGVHYVARPSGYLSSDGTHPVAAGHRIAGRRAAQRFIAEGYL